ncbi:MAG: RNA polymerase sigma factor [Planctomycetota bacterium]
MEKRKARVGAKATARVSKRSPRKTRAPAAPRSSSGSPKARAPATAAAAAEFGMRFAEVAPALYAWARLHIHAPLRRRLDPEDVLQEVCYRAMNALASFDAERASFRAWVFGIAHNVLREALRSLRTRGESVFGIGPRSTLHGLYAIAEEATRVSTRLARTEAMQNFLLELEQLEEGDRRLLLYRGLEGLRHHEVADLLEIEAGAVEKRWQRLRTKLQKLGMPHGLVVALDSRDRAK